VDSTDTDYLDAFQRGLLDPVECLERWEAAHAFATEQALCLAELEGKCDPAELDQAWTHIKAMLAEANRQRKAAQRRLAKHQEWNVTDGARQPPPSPPVPVMRARPRERRERHVARATSSSDSGDPDLADARRRRAEVLAGVRCSCCETVGRLVTVGRAAGVEVVVCSVCWAETTLHQEGS
jgi:hypothetical protein